MLIIAPDQETQKEYLFDFLSYEGMLCVLIRIASDSNEHTQYTIFNIKNLHYSKSAATDFFPRDSGTSSKQPVNEQSEFEPLKIHCKVSHLSANCHKQEN